MNIIEGDTVSYNGKHWYVCKKVLDILHIKEISYSGTIGEIIQVNEKYCEFETNFAGTI